MESASGYVKRTVWPYRPQWVGVAGGIALLALFFATLSVLNSGEHAIAELSRLWLWLLLLSAGFGTQVGLFWHLRTAARRSKGTAPLAASGGVSAGAMVACCLHHGADVLPLIGISGLALFFTEYQIFFIALGLASNLVGISIMLRFIQQCRAYDERGLLAKMLRFDMKKVRNGIIAFSAVALFLLLLITAVSCASPATPQTGPPGILLTPQSNDEGGVTVQVKPEPFFPGRPVSFEVVLDTHQGALDMDLTRITVLEDSTGQRYQSSGWEGDPGGGHHRSGKLTFPPPAADARWLTLTFGNIYGVPQRTFQWSLP